MMRDIYITSCNGLCMSKWTTKKERKKTSGQAEVQPGRKYVIEKNWPVVRLKYLQFCYLYIYPNEKNMILQSLK